MHLDVRKNFEEKVSYVARRINSMAVEDQSGLLSVDCGLPSDTFNVIVVRDWCASSQLLASVDRFTEKGFPFAIWFWESDGDQVGRATLLQHGLAHTETHSAMYADLSQIHMPSLHVAGLEIRQAATALDLLQCGEVIAALFGDSSEGRQVLAYFQKLCTYPISMFPAMRYYFGTLHGTVVAIGLLFVGSRATGIYDLVTRDDYRGKGIGSAMFQHLLKQACTENHRFCVLQASPDGLGIYVKAGFRGTGDVLTFEHKGTFPPEELSL
jgi:GNAT superfamily N-acetyltransferase